MSKKFKGGFTGHLDVREVESRYWILLAPLMYLRKCGRPIVVGEGFVTDLASIPRLFRVMLDVNGKHRKAAVLHDYLYSFQEFTRKQTDKIFLHAMESCGVIWWRRQAIYQGVRVGGWYRWNRGKK